MSATIERLENDLRAWAVGKSLFFAAQAIQTAAFSREFAELNLSHVGDAIQQDCTGRTDEDWRRYYLSVVDFAAELPLHELASEPAINAEFVYYAARLKAGDVEVVEALVQFLTAPEFAEIRKQMMRAGHAIGRANLEQAIRDAAAGGPKPFSNEVYERTRRLPSVSFLVRVFLPCIIEYGRTPQALFAAASQAGKHDLDALNQLVNIDHAIIHLPEVRTILEQPDRNATADNYRFAAAALFKPSSPPTALDVKQRAASYIWRLGKYLDEAVTSTEIHRLFDLMAQIGDASQLVDPDFAGLQPDSFRRMLTRQGKTWDEVLADKDFTPAVRALRKGAA